MPETYIEPDGRIMVREPAGGSGGGVTSWATRPASLFEQRVYHDQQVAVAEAALTAANDAQKAHAEENKPAVARAGTTAANNPPDTPERPAERADKSTGPIGISSGVIGQNTGQGAATMGQSPGQMNPRQPGQTQQVNQPNQPSPFVGGQPNQQQQNPQQPGQMDQQNPQQFQQQPNQQQPGQQQPGQQQTNPTHPGGA